MEDEKELNGGTAPTAEGVEKTVEAPATEKAEEISPELISQLEELLAENEKVKEERDNYKKGLLKAKGKISEDDGEKPAETTPEVRQVVREELEQILKQKEIGDKKDKLIRELKVALSSRSQVSTAASGGSSDKPQISNSNLSPAQIEEIKAKYPHLAKDEKWMKTLQERLRQV